VEEGSGAVASLLTFLSARAPPLLPLSPHSQPHVVAVFKALATGAPAAGLAIGDVKTSVSLVPPPLPEAGRALLGAVAAGLAAAGWWVSGGPPGEDAGVGLTLMDTAPAACAGPLLSCTVLRLASAAPRPPADLALTLTASAGRARRLAAASLGEGAIATAPAAVRTELAGTRCCALPDFAPVIVVDAWARYEGDEALVAAWDAVLGGGGAAGPPSLWVWVIPDDGREDEGPATPGALCAPPAALWEAPGLICLPPGSRAGGGGAALVRAAADAVSGSAAGALARVWGGRLEAVGLVQQQQAAQPPPPSCAFVAASALAPGSGGGCSLPTIQLDPLPAAGQAAAAGAGPPTHHHHHQPSAALSALLAEAGGGGRAGADAAATARLAAARAALASAASCPPPGGVPRLGLRLPYTLGVGGSARARAAAGEGGGGGGGAVAKKRAAPAAKRAVPAVKAAATAAAGSVPVATHPKPAKAALSAADAAAATAKVRAAGGIGGEAALAKLTVDELKAFLKAAGGAVGGKKAVLVGRVVEVLGKEGGGGAAA